MDWVPVRSKLRGITWNKPVYLVVGLISLAWLLLTPNGLLGKADAVGYALCHRIDLRSFHLGDRPLPLCVRCTGMYLGAVLGLIYQSIVAPRCAGTPPRRVLLPVVILVLAFVIDGLNSYLSLLPGMPYLYEPRHWLRLLTGSGMGLAVAIALFPAFNQTAWTDWEARPAIAGLRSFGRLLFLALLLDLLVLSQNPLLLYPFALLSAAGAMLLLSKVYAMAGMILFHQENRYGSWRALALPLLAGLGLALVQIGLLDAGRFWLTGTWDGFQFG